MKCFVQNCLNDDSKNTNKSLGITFHRLPTHPDDGAAWVQVSNDAGCRLSKRLVVCSEHYKAEDFDVTLPNQRRFRNEVVSSVATTNDQAEIKVCRVCLALDVKMYDVKDFKLSEMFQNITGILACDKKESILHRVCWECAARLKAAAAFRNKALLSDALLKNLVHINKSDIVTLKQNHSSLKSTLTVHTALTSSDIECEHTIFEHKVIKTVPNDETDIKESRIKNEEGQDTEFEEFKPWIGVAVKMEIECDPIDENNIDNEAFSESTHFNDDSKFKDDNEYEIRNTELKIDIEEDTKVNYSPIDDKSKIVLLDNEETKIKLEVVSITDDETSCEEDTESFTEVVSANEVKKKINKVGSNRFTDAIKEKIIALKKNGLTGRAISKETGMTVESIDRWWRRYRKNGYTYRRSTTAGSDRQMDNKPSDQNYLNLEEPTKEMGVCSAIVRQRLIDAGFEHILVVKKPETTGNMEQKNISNRRALHYDLKQRIIALKQEGMTNSRIAFLLDISRFTVRKWWERWCKEGHMQNYKQPGRKRKTTVKEDQLLIERVTQEQPVHTPTLAKEFGLSLKCVRNRLQEAGFKQKERKAYAPFNSGRSQKVDEKTKQQIISMKLNGVSVTDIANQFRVPRSTIYQWWHRWSKEHNINTDNENCDDVEKIVQTPSILSAQKTLWQKVPKTEFKS